MDDMDRMDDMDGMSKRRLVEQILEHLEAERARCVAAAREAQADATDEQNKAENKYDTRGLEASYLARGQALQTAELDQACHFFAALPVRNFAAGEGAAVGALLEVEQEGYRDHYFLGPAAGGLEIEADGEEVIVVSAHSPLGQSLLGKRAGDTLPGGGRIVSVA